MAEKSGGEKAAETASDNHSQPEAGNALLKLCFTQTATGMVPLPPMRCEPEGDSRLLNRFDVFTHRFDGRVR
jgi:hypothetical protein